MEQIVIIGGGLSARLLTIQLVKNAGRRPLRIVIVEAQDKDRMGDAFCTDTELHLLNVPAGRMSAYPDDTDHLIDWLSSHGYSYGRTSFIPRKLYKTYITEVFRQEIDRPLSDVQVSFVHDEAIDIQLEPLVVLLHGGGRIQAHKIVLAVGNFPPSSLKIAGNDYLSNPRYYASAWIDGFLQHLRPTDPVLILGTGLTMVDVILQLQQRNHRGPVTAISNHGWIPASHRQTSEYPSFYDDLKDAHTMIALIRVFRRHLRMALAGGNDWRAVIDAIRPHAQTIWMNLDIAEKRRFMRHLRHFWGVARHRMPPGIAALLETQIDSKALTIIAGRTTAISNTEQGDFIVTYRPRNTQKKKQFSTACIINCMGPEGNWNKIRQRLLINLLQKKCIEADEMQLGINCTPEGRVIGKDQIPSDCLFTIGPPAKGILWEITAVPEIRTQARRLAALLVETIPDKIQL